MPATGAGDKEITARSRERILCTSGSTCFPRKIFPYGIVPVARRNRYYIYVHREAVYKPYTESDSSVVKKEWGCGWGWKATEHRLGVR